MDDHERNLFPNLSDADRDLLADRIASTDGVPRTEALRQIEEFMSIDLGALIERPAEARVERAAEPALTASTPEDSLPWVCAT